MTVKFTNNASTTVGTGINASATSLTVASASSFPSLSGADDYCYLTIQGATNTAREVVKATALSSNTFTIVRAQDNTSAGTWSAGDIVELRMTAALLTDVIDAATVEGVKTNYQYTPTAGQTVFSGADNASATMIINQAALVSVYMNGVRLVQGTDYSVSSANNTVTLGVGATTADIIDIEVYGNFVGQSGAAVGITGGSITGTAITATTLGATGTATLNTLVSNNATISGGSLDGVTIGGTTRGAISGNAISGTSFASTGNMTFGDNDMAIFGDGSDFEIYFNGNHGVMRTASASVGGNIYIQDDNNIVLGSIGGENYLNAAKDGAVTLYYDNAAKLATTASGIDITGTATMDGLTVSASATDFEGVQILNTNTAASPTTASILLGVTNSVRTVNTKIQAIEGGSDANETDLAFFTNTGGNVLTKAMTIDSSQNVGIGTDSPAIGGGRTYNVALTIDGGVSGSLEDTGALEVGGSTSVNDRLVGSISYFNRDNSGAGATTRRQVAIIEARSVTSDSNAGDDSGANLTFSTKSEGGSVAERLRISASGNAGLGVVPSAWHASWKALQIGPIGFVGSYQAGTTDITALGTNVYSDGAYKYIEEDEAVIYKQQNGEHIFDVAASGSADAAISWTTAMTISNAGNVGLGVAPPAWGSSYLALTVGTAGAFWASKTGASLTAMSDNSYLDGSVYKARNTGAGAMFFQSAGAHVWRNFASVSAGATQVAVNAMTLDASGNLGISNSIASDFNAGANTLVVGSGSGSKGMTIYGSTQSNIFFADGTAGTAAYIGRIEYSHSADSMAFYVNNSPAMTIDSSGNLIVSGTSAGDATSVALHNGGYVHAVSSHQMAGIFDRRDSDGDILVFRKDGSGTAVGNIGTKSGDMYVGTGNTTLRFNDADDAIHAGGGNGNGTNNGTDLGSALYNFGDLYLSGGAYLGGTAAANKLDDYEEGTWTPVIKESNGSGTTLVLSSSSGSYTKFGKTVTITGYFIRNDTTSLTGALVISNLPFTQAGGPQTGGSIWVDNATSDVLGLAYGNNGSLCYWRSIPDPNNYIAISQFENLRSIYFSRTYITT